MLLKISENRRYISDQNGQPFFYLADTSWEMLHRLSEDETEFYLQDRAAKGFTVIQTVILAELDGLQTPNRKGDIPFENLDPTKPNEAYFAHVDWALEAAARQGLFLGLLPTWGDKWNVKWGVGPIVFTPENARVYGEYLGHRYGNKPNIIWILGGDRPVDNETHRAIINAMAEGIRAGGSSHLRTFHPQGGGASSTYFHDVGWLDFNMWQTGHKHNSPNFDCIASDYLVLPTKPTMDGEPGYEDHKFGLTPESGYSDDYDCRKGLYWALFSGACGHTYGCHPIWQFWQKGLTAVNHPRRDWREAMMMPGSGQMIFARKLQDQYQFLLGKPAPELVVSQPLDTEGQEDKGLHIAALLGADADFALLYFPMNSVTDVRMESLRGSTIRAIWLNPRNGEVESEETVEKTVIRTFTPPDWGPDWILILEAHG